MKTRTLGNRLFGPPADKAEMVRLIRAAHERGVTLFDTAESYGPFVNEELVGEALEPVRDKVVIATKFGFDIDLETGERRGGTNSRPEHIKGRGGRVPQALAYRPYRPLLSTPRGSRGADRERCRRSEGPHRGGQGQAFWALRGRRPDGPPRPCRPASHRVCKANIRCSGAGRRPSCSPCSTSSASGSCRSVPFGAGFLTGKIDPNTKFDPTDFRNNVPRFSPEARKANMALVDVVKVVADRKAATPAQVALGWLLAQRSWIVPIPGTTKLHRLEENLGAVELALTPADLQEIDAEVGKITVQGERLPEAALKMTGR